MLSSLLTKSDCLFRFLLMFNRVFHLPHSRLADGYTTGWWSQICFLIFTPTWGNAPF